MNHRLHIACVAKSRYKVLHNVMQERIRDIIRRTSVDMSVHIVRGVLARDLVDIFLSIPLKSSLSDVMQRIQIGYPDLRKCFRAGGFSSRDIPVLCPAGQD